ncbi:Hypothetical predicted protein [Pelobates cultripes]|uniref:Uncharacterized protein n=1 Tax=Pelobates cultripes TaxID=61616 RepID=A0AAD1QZU3_PELCU|nr:Hypothetical predicted protein [Pelobates cultripes]
MDKYKNSRQNFPHYTQYEPRYRQNPIPQTTYKDALEKKQTERKVENKYEKKEWRNYYDYKPYFRSRRVSFRDKRRDENERRSNRLQGERERISDQSPYYERTTQRRDRERHQPQTREPLRVYNQYQALENREGEQDFWRSRIIERHKEELRRDFPPNLKRRRYSFQEEREEENQSKKDKRERKEKD